MIVTSIEKQKKNQERYSVFIDGEFSFGLIMQDILYFKLKEGTEISSEKYDFIMENLVYIKAQDTAIKYLSYKSRTEKEVILKLEEKEYSKEVIEKVLDFLIKYHYVDDKKYCESYINESIKLKPKSKFLLKMELNNRGVKSDIIDEVINNSGIDEESCAVLLLKKKIKDFSSIDEKQRNRAIGYLQRKGFSYDKIQTAFKICIEENEDL